MKKQLIPIFLSPHLDDAVLSCGGLIRQLAKKHEKVQVVTVFSGIPVISENPSSFLLEIHSLYGNKADIVQVRRKEDEAAVSSLGADFIHLDFLDAIYRKDENNHYYILSAEDIYGGPKQPDLGLPQMIAAKVASLFTPAESQLYAPIGIGNHIDHRLTHTAAVLLKEQGYPLILYEDYPYSENQTNTQSAYTALSGILQFKKIKVRLSEMDREQKIQAIACYQTQLHMLFGGQDPMRARVQNHFRKKGETYLVVK